MTKTLQMLQDAADVAESTGLFISAAVPTLQALEEQGKGEGDDYSGDSLANASIHHRTHHAALRAWYNAAAAVAAAPVILGDKD